MVTYPLSAHDQLGFVCVEICNYSLCSSINYLLDILSSILYHLSPTAPTLIPTVPHKIYTTPTWKLSQNRSIIRLHLIDIYFRLSQFHWEIINHATACAMQTFIYTKRLMIMIILSYYIIEICFMSNVEIVREPGAPFNIHISCYQWRNSLCGGKSKLRNCYLRNGNEFATMKNLIL